MTTRLEQLRLGDYETTVPVSPVPGEIGTGFLYFSTNNDKALKAEGARLIAEHIARRGYKAPFLIAPETAMVGITSILEATVPGLDAHTMSKRRRPGDAGGGGDEDDAIASFEYFAVTNVSANTLYIPRDLDLTGREVIVVDDVCVTGNSVRACCELLRRLRKPVIPVEAVVLFTGGGRRDHVDLADGTRLPLISFGHIPLYELPALAERPQFVCCARTPLPVEVRGDRDDPDFGRPVAEADQADVCLYAFRHPQLGKEALAFVKKSGPGWNGGVDVVTRCHDCCVTSEIFRSLKCDCRHQLDEARRVIARDGGVLIYLNREGRGVGLPDDDARSYVAARDILLHLGVSSVRLLTNNPRKTECLRQLGVAVTGTLPIAIKATSKHMAGHLRDKAVKMGHVVPAHYYDWATERPSGRTELFASPDGSKVVLRVTSIDATRGPLYFYEPDKDHGWLSNFFLAPFTCDRGLAWPSSEHYYQAQQLARMGIYGASPDTALVRVNDLTIGKSAREVYAFCKGHGKWGWTPDQRLAWMRKALRLKFDAQPGLRSLLLATWERDIHEDSPIDAFWGWRGQDHLGRLLMELRSQYRSEAAAARAEVAGTPAEEPAAIAGATGALTELFSIAAETPANLAEAPATLAGESANLAEAPATLAGESANLAEAPSTFAEAAATLAGESATPAEALVNLAGEFATFAEAPANLAEELATPAEAAANLAEEGGEFGATREQ